MPAAWLLMLALPATGVTEELRESAILVLPLKAISVDPGETQILDAQLVKLLSESAGTKIVDPRDIAAYVNLQAEKAQLTGECIDESCLAEMADALGAGQILHGQVGRLGELFVMQLTVFDGESGTSTARAEQRAENIEGLSAGMGKIVNELLGLKEPEAPRAVEGNPVLFWTGTGLVVAGALGTALLGGQALSLNGQLLGVNGAVSREAKSEALRTGWVFGLGAMASMVVVAVGGGLIVEGL